MAAKTYTRKQIEELDKKEANYFIIDNAVYEVKAFLDEHPGGHEVLEQAAGTDATEDFNDIGHSLDAKELLKKWKVGEIVQEERWELKKSSNSWSADQSGQDQGFLSGWKLPLILGIIATLLYKYIFG